ncbi:MAG: hypothetical protein Q8R98_12070, partial [Rubrivivax sp.]|nr:hypothetical protein [Rubrivivax sp.]
MTLAVVACTWAAWAPAAHAQASARATAGNAAAAHPSTAFWRDAGAQLAATSSRGTAPAVRASRLRATTLDRLSMAAQLASAPMEGSTAARQSPLVIALPSPDGSFQRFQIVESPIME